VKIPSEGLTRTAVFAKLEQFKKRSHMDAEGKKKVSFGAYRWMGLPEIRALVENSAIEFLDSVPSTNSETGMREMHGEVVSMIGSLWGSNEATGFMTSGGTESNIIAMYVAKSMAASGKSMSRGSVVIPSTALTYFRKACTLLDLEPISVPVKEDGFTADPEKMREAVRKDTIAVVATCGINPWGGIDPIEEIGKLAVEKSLYFHVDAAYGGMLCPFLKDAGYEIPEFGFEVKGVSSVSADPHKTGFSICPAGILLFRESDMTKVAKWEYKTESYASLGEGLLGTRPGYPVAVTWALLNYLGRKGYTTLARKCMQITEDFMRDLRNIPGLTTSSMPKINIAHASSSVVNMEKVHKRMVEDGWYVYYHAGKPRGRDDVIWMCMYPYQESTNPGLLKELDKIMSDFTKTGAKTESREVSAAPVGTKRRK
jgi:tyrosine decarboxylase/aspartate 1-decarboxylase